MKELVDLLERQISYVQRQPGDSLFLALHRFVEFVTNEPRLAAVIEDFELEYKDERLKFEQTDDTLVAEFELFWDEHETWFVRAWDAMFETGRDTPVMHKFGHPRDTREFLRATRLKTDQGVSYRIESSRLTDVFSRMDTMWIRCVEKESLSEQDLSRFRQGYRIIGKKSDFARRRREAVELTHPGASWRRLSWAANNVCPSDASNPVGLSEDDEEQAAGASIEGLEISNAALGRNGLTLNVPNLEPRRSILQDDLETLREEMVRRIGLHLSHHALVSRFKSKCERFLSAELRTKCLAKGRKPEDVLTLVAAEYLFEQGLNPLFNAQIVTLRPDLFDGSLPHALYIEAKQYADGHNLAKVIQKAAWQVWDTWNELDGQHRVTEAFLLVFRRGGPLIVFEGSARMHGRTLHPVLVDIAPTDLKGSRANSGPMAISSTDLLPAAQQKSELKVPIRRKRKARA